MLFILQLDCTKWVTMKLSQLVPSRVMLCHVFNETWVIELLQLDLSLIISALSGLIVLQAVAEGLVQISDLIIFPVRIFNRGSIESSQELTASDGAFSGTRPAHLLREDRVIEDA